VQKEKNPNCLGRYIGNLMDNCMIFHLNFFFLMKSQNENQMMIRNENLIQTILNVNQNLIFCRSQKIPSVNLNQIFCLILSFLSVNLIESLIQTILSENQNQIFCQNLNFQSVNPIESLILSFLSVNLIESLIQSILNVNRNLIFCQNQKFQSVSQNLIFFQIHFQMMFDKQLLLQFHCDGQILSFDLGFHFGPDLGVGLDPDVGLGVVRY